MGRLQIINSFKYLRGEIIRNIYLEIYWLKLNLSASNMKEKSRHISRLLDLLSNSVGFAIFAEIVTIGSPSKSTKWFICRKVETYSENKLLLDVLCKKTVVELFYNLWPSRA